MHTCQRRAAVWPKIMPHTSHIVSVITCVHVFMAKVHLRTPQQPSFYHYNLTKKGPNGKIQAPNRSSSDDAAIGVQKVLLQFLYLVAVLEMAYF